MVRVSRKFFTVALTVALFASPMTALAAHPTDGKADIENLRQRIEALESDLAAAKRQEPEQPLRISSLADKITLGGLIELEAGYNKPEGGDESSDLTLATVELGLEVQATDYLGGHIVLLWEEGETDSIELDEAVITLTKPQPVWGVTPSFSGGKMYLPFGKFNSTMITDPLTLDLGETNQSAGVMTLEGELWTLQAGAFSGETDTRGDHDTIDSWVAALEARPFETLSFGLSLISDLAESDLELVTDDNAELFYTSSVMGGSAWLSWQFGQFGFEAEYLTALSKFNRDLVLAGDTDLTGRRPSAWNLELAWMPNDRWQVAGRFEQADDFQDDVTRYGGTVSYGLFEHAVLALEYLHGDAKGPDADPDHTVTAQLAFEF
jgi:hypothetical protein